MRATELSHFLGDTLDIKEGTVTHYAKSLREAALLTKGKQGRYAGAVMTNSDVANLALALVLDHRRGESIAANVRKARKLPLEKLILLPPALGPDISCFSATTAGAALDALVDDFRHGRVIAWAADEEWELSVTIEARGRSVIIALM